MNLMNMLSLGVQIPVFKLGFIIFLSVWVCDIFLPQTLRKKFPCLLPALSTLTVLAILWTCFSFSAGSSSASQETDTPAAETEMEEEEPQEEEPQEEEPQEEEPQEEQLSFEEEKKNPGENPGSRSELESASEKNHGTEGGGIDSDLPKSSGPIHVGILRTNSGNFQLRINGVSMQENLSLSKIVEKLRHSAIAELETDGLTRSQEVQLRKVLAKELHLAKITNSVNHLEGE